MSIQTTDQESAAIASAAHIALTDIESYIAAQYEFTADKALGEGVPVHDALKLLSICILVMKNGFTVIGQSAPTSPENFNAELGRQFAYEHAIGQLLMNFSFCDRLSHGVSV